MERWETIKDHPDYEVSNLGDVRNKKTGRILSTYFNNGYRRVKIGGKQCYVSKLMADAFPITIDEPCEFRLKSTIVRCEECARRYEFDICEGKDDGFYCAFGER